MQKCCINPRVVLLSDLLMLFPLPRNILPSFFKKQSVLYTQSVVRNPHNFYQTLSNSQGQWFLSINFKILIVFCLMKDQPNILPPSFKSLIYYSFQNSVRGGGFVIWGLTKSCERVLSTPVGQKRLLAYSQLMESTLAFEFAASAVMNSLCAHSFCAKLN